MTAPEGRTPATAAGRALLSHATEAYWSHPPLDLLSEIKQGVLAIEAEAAAGVRVAEPDLRAAAVLALKVRDESPEPWPVDAFAALEPLRHALAAAPAEPKP